MLWDIKLGTPPAGTRLQALNIDNQGNFVDTFSDGSTATTNAVLLQNYNNPAALEHFGNNLYRTWPPGPDRGQLAERGEQHRLAPAASAASRRGPSRGRTST